ncbi:MAG: DM13 domain-containing protein [Geminicoccaceae bacterium]
MRKFFLPVFLGVALGLAALPASAGDILAKGSFTGASDHVTTGGVHVTAETVELQDDFSLDGAPDPKVGFGKDGVYDSDTTLAVLESNTGAQTYQVPDGVDPSAYNEVYIWCEEFSVPLGVAKLQ